jgi:hypothetical protein
MAVRFGEALHRWGLLHHPTRDVTSEPHLCIWWDNVKRDFRPTRSAVPAPAPTSSRTTMLGSNKEGHSAPGQNLMHYDKSSQFSRSWELGSGPCNIRCNQPPTVWGGLLLIPTCFHTPEALKLGLLTSTIRKNATLGRFVRSMRNFSFII